MDDPRNLWQNQEVEEMKIPVEQLRAKAAKFQSRILWRNVREHVAALIVILWAGTTLWRASHAPERIGFALLIAAAIYYMWHLWTRGFAKPLPAALAAADCVRFYRGELERQRDLLRSIWKWAIGPIIPGVALLDIYALISPPSGRRLFSVISIAVQAAIVLIVGWLNLRAAKRLDLRIKELDRELGRV